MANTYTTPNMDLVLPTVQTDPGPDYAQRIDTALQVVDAHNHTSGNGVPVPTAGININADLPANDFSFTGIKNLVLNLVSAVVSAVRGALSTDGTDLWFTDGNGNEIQITKNGGVGSPSAASANLMQSSGSGASAQTNATATPTAVTGTTVSITTGPQGVIDLSLQQDGTGGSLLNILGTSGVLGYTTGSFSIKETAVGLGIVNQLAGTIVTGEAATASISYPPGSLNCKLALAPNTEYTFTLYQAFTGTTGGGSETSVYSVKLVAQAW